MQHMSLTINIYYKVENGNARKFAEEMMKEIATLRKKYNLNMRVEKFTEVK